MEDKCHCGKEIYYLDDFTRGLCLECTLERCDIPDEFPPSCSPRRDLVS